MVEISPKEAARTAIDHADARTRQFILELALERARIQHTAALALDARITQASYLQFAAAAVSAAFAGASGIQIAGGLAAISAIAFVVGGVLCFRGVRSDPYHAPGLPPAWWIRLADYEQFGLADAQCWAAGAIQDMLDHTDLENEKRAAALNLGLKYSMGGGIIVCLAALSRLVFA